MLTTGMQNLPEPLARAPAAYHDGTARLAPASADRLARRVEHFASSVQLVLDDPDAAQRLHALTKDLRPVPQLRTLLPQVLRGAMALVGGDFGNIQIVDPATESLRLVTRVGFGLEFLDYFAVVEDVHSTCGRTARQGALHLGRPSGDGPTDPVGRALVTALLDPARVRGPDVSVPFELRVMRRMTVSLARWAGLAGGAPSPPDGGRSL